MLVNAESGVWIHPLTVVTQAPRSNRQQLDVKFNDRGDWYIRVEEDTR